MDNSLEWELNDSLISIPHIDNSIIITNPPYLSNYSASRKKIDDKVEKYFSSSSYDDVYLIALDKMTDAQDYVVAIIPAKCPIATLPYIFKVVTDIFSDDNE